MIETALAAEKEKVKAATQHAKDLRERKKQLSNGKRINVCTAGRGFQMLPVASTSTDKENSLFLEAPSSHSVAVSPFHLGTTLTLLGRPIGYGVGVPNVGSCGISCL